MKKSEIEEIEAIKTQIEKTNIDIMGIHYTGFTIQIFFALPKGFFGTRIHNDLEQALLARIQYLYPEIIFRRHYGMYDVIWGLMVEQIKSLFLFEDTDIYFLNIQNSLTEFEDLRKKFKTRWNQTQK